MSNKANLNKKRIRRTASAGAAPGRAAGLLKGVNEPSGAGGVGGGRKSLLSDTGSVRWTSALHSSPSHTHARVSAVGLERVMWA